MSTPDNFTDSTDWLNTPLAALAPIDASLRCQVCKDYFTTPMITSCSHTFCSLCIRRYLSQEGRCPACRESDQEIKLRRNWSVEESVVQFKTGRDELLKVARRVEEESVEGPRPKKRRKIEQKQVLPERRSTRSQSRRIVEQDPQHAYSVPSSQDEVQDSDGGSVYEDGSAQQQDSKPDDGLVECPICSRRMKEAVINTHLDKCMKGEATPSPPRSITPMQSSSIAYGQTKPIQSQERLPTINYSMLNDNALRRKLKELGIPNHGSKELMRKRHTEWVNLWNANCDSLHPVSKKQLLQDLEKWERTLGRQVDRGPNGVMVKDFDRDGWQKSNKGDFDDLIKKAREKRKAVAAVTKSDEPDPHLQNGEAAGETEKKSIEQIFTGAVDESIQGTALNGNHNGENSNALMGGTTPVPIAEIEGSGAVASGALTNGES